MSAEWKAERVFGGDRWRVKADAGGFTVDAGRTFDTYGRARWEAIERNMDPARVEQVRRLIPVGKKQEKHEEKPIVWETIADYRGERGVNGFCIPGHWPESDVLAALWEMGPNVLGDTLCRCSPIAIEPCGMLLCDEMEVRSVAFVPVTAVLQRWRVCDGT